MKRIITALLGLASALTAVGVAVAFMIVRIPEILIMPICVITAWYTMGILMKWYRKMEVKKNVDKRTT